MNLGGLSNILIKGITIEAAPSIAGGMLVEFLQTKRVDVERASAWVQSNVSLWSKLTEQEQQTFKGLARRINYNLEWLTAEWAIEATKSDLPALASLFLGWPKANNWLKRQAEIIKEKVRT